MNKVLITGCSSGLGLALTQLYLNKGFNVIGIARTKPNITNKHFKYIQCDLADINNIKSNLEHIILNEKKIELVYLNAGMLGEIKSSFELSTEELNEVYSLNVYANKELLDILAKINTKKVVAISSGAAVNGSNGWAAYSLSKAGLNMLINLYSKEMINTKLLAVAPGVIETPMTDYIRFEIDDTVFTSAQRLKNGEIQTPTQAASRLDKVIDKFDEFESGSFIDVRNI